MQTIQYGHVGGASLLADIASPDASGPLPVILSIHGGRWYFGTRKDTGAIDVDQWAGFGFFAMSIDYRLVTCTPAPAAYQDVLCAIRWVHAHAHEYRLDRERIFLIGMSSGGHLAALAATLGAGRFPQTGGWDDFPVSFRAAICVSGAYDIVSLDWGAGWAPPGEPFPDARLYASPIRHVGPGNTAQLIIHSDDDPSIPIEQVLRMTAALREAGARHRFVRYADRGHMFITEEVIAAARAFITETVGLVDGDYEDDDDGHPLVALCVRRPGTRRDWVALGRAINGHDRANAYCDATEVSIAQITALAGLSAFEKYCVLTCHHPTGRRSGGGRKIRLGERVVSVPTSIGSGYEAARRSVFARLAEAGYKFVGDVLTDASGTRVIFV